MSTSKPKSWRHFEKSRGMASGYPPQDGRYPKPGNLARETASTPSAGILYSSPDPGGLISESRRLDDYQDPYYSNVQSYYPDEQPPQLNENNSRQNKPTAPKPEENKKSKSWGSSLSAIRSAIFLSSSKGGGGSSRANAGGQDRKDPERELERALKNKSSELKAMRQQKDFIEQRRNQDKENYKQELEDLRTTLEKSFDEERARWDQSLESASSQLQSAKDEVSKLQKCIAKNEAVVTKAHETMLSSLSKGVSRAFTDDMIKDELKRFYQNQLLPWCADMSSSKIPKSEEVKERLQRDKIINSSEAYLRESINLQFSMNLPDDSSSLVLLQAVLSQTLCQTFLQDAYFLAEGIQFAEIPGRDAVESRRRLKELEDLFYQVDKNACVDWRIRTVESLEKAMPLGPRLVENKAKAFIQNYPFLLKDEVDDQALKDLIQLFVDFGSMTLNLWKTRTIIKVYGLPNFAKYKFSVDSIFIEADGVTSLASRRRLQGRPIGVVIRPLITSEPLGQDGEASKEIVWLKAVGWVSTFEDSIDLDTPMRDANRIVAT
ncbi:hypothetical protein V8C42DRAFT_288560 [Trichoderma barbatum]